MKAVKGDWVRIHSIVLPAGERASSVPDDTSRVALELWNKGLLLDEGAEIGDTVKIETYIGRVLEGELIEVNPHWHHNYGEFVPELLHIGREARKMIEEKDNE